MKDVPIGAKGSYAMLVGPQHLASQFKDAILPPVFATPMMVLAMENAALNAIREYLEPGESAVGTKVEVSHLAATPAGQWVRAEAEVVGSEGRHLAFRVAAFDETETIGTGTHERVVVDLDRTGRRLEAKRREAREAKEARGATVVEAPAGPSGRP
ncbi:thioesterase family protein [Methylobacterium oxalidis]|uniref:thioesterase family protein n=1 Tax=Methylobacterium oxalidis TaxID=944322 RepID=UPI0033156202